MKHLPAYNLIVKENILKEELSYKNHVILTYTIKYPEIISDYFRDFLNRLNLYYKFQAESYQKTRIAKLYRLAVENFEYSVANGFPVHTYEVIIEYTVTDNTNCTLSLYFDRYEYTGGAHGITFRNSDTWDLVRGKRMGLEEFFPENKDFIKFVQNEIIRQIEVNIENDENIYFDDYADLVKENFNVKNFFITDSGVVVFFQLYEIAPYASGIQTFLIPYSENLIIPEC